LGRPLDEARRQPDRRLRRHRRPSHHGTAQNSGSQPGDPVRAAEAMIQVTEQADAPRHLVLGAFGVAAVTSKLEAALADIAAWRKTSLASDFPKD
jgi:hypothetical protein